MVAQLRVKIVLVDVHVERVRRNVLHLYTRRVTQILEVLVHELLQRVQVLKIKPFHVRIKPFSTNCFNESRY